jgi:hypothetical protein
MFSRNQMAIAPVIFLVIGVLAATASFTPPAHASEPVECKIPMKSCAAEKETEAPAVPEAEKPQYQGELSLEKLSLYKTITYVTGATLTDQLWYLAIASAAATTGGIFLGVNAATSSMMTYSYEYFWNLCCQADPGPDGVVPVSATKAVIYRGLSVIRVSALALIFGNTVASSAVVTGAITLSRTAVYVANDFFWNGINATNPTDPTVIDVSIGAGSGAENVR